MVTMCIRFVLEAAISFRAIPKSVHVVFSSFAIFQKTKIPCPNTILRWLTKVGLYNLLSEKEQADDWAAIADHTVQLGDQKCLVILGVRLSKLTGNPLTLKDMKVISIEVHKSSKAEIMDEALERAQKKVGTIEMVCADDGPDLRGGIERFCERNKAGRSFDIAHKAATYLKKILNNQEQWKNFTTAAAESKKKMQQSKTAHLAPPNQRTKSRFLNL